MIHNVCCFQCCHSKDEEDQEEEEGREDEGEGRERKEGGPWNKMGDVPTTQESTTVQERLPSQYIIIMILLILINEILKNIVPKNRTGNLVFGVQILHFSAHSLMQFYFMFLYSS